MNLFELLEYFFVILLVEKDLNSQFPQSKYNQCAGPLMNLACMYPALEDKICETTLLCQATLRFANCIISAQEEQLVFICR